MPTTTVTPVCVADLLAENERMPVYVHVIDHPDARVLVDTGITELHPAAADLDPRLRPLSEQEFDLAAVDIVVNTHLHFDHCGGNHLFAGKPIYVQRQELDDARGEDDYTIREWVDAPGVRYLPVDGELELLPGIRLVPAPGHTRGMQVVVIETAGRPVVVGGDVAVWFGELDEPQTEGQRRVRALDPELVWLTHEHEPWRPASALGARNTRAGSPRGRQVHPPAGRTNPISSLPISILPSPSTTAGSSAASAWISASSSASTTPSPQEPVLSITGPKTTIRPASMSGCQRAAGRPMIARSSSLMVRAKSGRAPWSLITKVVMAAV
jgi:N-acyl homoserine lactone hydrolase